MTKTMIMTMTDYDYDYDYDYDMTLPMVYLTINKKIEEVMNPDMNHETFENIFSITYIQVNNYPFMTKHEQTSANT